MITVTPFINSFHTSWSPAPELDEAGYKLHAVNSLDWVNGDFTPTDQNLINEGPETSFFYKCPRNGTWGLRVCSYDTFGDEANLLNYSSMVTVNVADFTILPDELYSALRTDFFVKDALFSFGERTGTPPAWTTGTTLFWDAGTIDRADKVYTLAGGSIATAQSSYIIATLDGTALTATLSKVAYGSGVPQDLTVDQIIIAVTSTQPNSVGNYLCYVRQANSIQLEGAMIRDATIVSAKIIDLTADKINAGSLTLSWEDGHVKCGKAGYTDNTSQGFFIGKVGAVPKVNIGNATSYFRYDAGTGNLSFAGDIAMSADSTINWAASGIPTNLAALTGTESVNNDLIQIGGRNLYKKTTSIVDLATGSSLVARSITGFTLLGIGATTGIMRMGVVIPKNGTFVISFDLAVSLAGGYPLIQNFCDTETWIINPTTTVQHFSHVFEIVNYSSGTYNFIDFNGLSDQWYLFTNFKIEEGNKETSWTPAPEDVDASIATAATTADWAGIPDSPTLLAAPAGSGLFVGATYMGYYASSAWQSYIKNDGTFYFKGNATNYINWDGTDFNVRGKLNASDVNASNFTAQTANIAGHAVTVPVYGETASTANWTGTGIVFSSTETVEVIAIIHATNGAPSTVGTVTLTQDGVTIFSLGVWYSGGMNSWQTKINVPAGAHEYVLSLSQPGMEGRITLLGVQR